MRILFFSTSFPNPLRPRQASFNQTMVAGLAAEHAVQVVSPVPWTVELTAWRAGRVIDRGSPQTMDGVPAVYPRYYYPPGILRHRYDEWMWSSVRQSLDASFREFRPDVVLSYWAHPDGAVAARAARLHGVPAVTMVGGSDVLVLGRNPKRRRAVLAALQSADGIVAVSCDICERLREWGLDGERLWVVRRGVDTAVFGAGDRLASRDRLGVPAEGAVIVSAGRLVPVKGHDVLIEACRQLRDRGVRFRCYVLGEGPLRRRLARRIRKGRLEDFVRLHGNCGPQELAEWYRAADLTVLPSRSEGVPNVLLESMSCGTPFVASAVGGIPEIADPAHDRLVPPDDAGALAEAIAERLSGVRSTAARAFLPSDRQAASRELAEVLSRFCSSDSSRPSGDGDRNVNSPQEARTKLCRTC